MLNALLPVIEALLLFILQLTNPFTVYFTIYLTDTELNSMFTRYYSFIRK